MRTLCSAWSWNYGTESPQNLKDNKEITNCCTRKKKQKDRDERSNMSVQIKNLCMLFILSSSLLSSLICTFSFLFWPYLNEQVQLLTVETSELRKIMSSFVETVRIQTEFVSGWLHNYIILHVRCFGYIYVMCCSLNTLPYIYRQKWWERYIIYIGNVASQLAIFIYSNGINL